MKIAVDSSVIVAGFSSWHEAHDEARDGLDRGPLLIAHCALEAYSVLTRMPAPYRVSPDIVSLFLKARFPKRPIILPAARQASIVERLAKTGIRGGAVYDAFVGLTAAHHGATLLTLDGRAQPTYTQLAIAFVPLRAKTH